ncbi:MAG: VWA domain-containing protein [Desulfobacterales bacterium]|nr:VWA domain-containing protein [Desulfobacterales bacterium]MBF0396649.1 VWA domain-containing protein [Desulfobacterales bacterium]
MPKLMNTDNMQNINISGPGSFQFSSVRIENLEATEYTIVTIVVDETGSVTNFAGELLKCVKSIIESCKKSPRSENLLIRLVAFNDKIREIHGFKLLKDININDYKPFKPQGVTGLYDAAYSSICATLEQAKRLIDQDFDANGAVYIITDGLDNCSKMKPQDIAKRLDEALHNEKEIESIISILIGLHDIGISSSNDVQRGLSYFQAEANISQFIDVGDATPAKLAKLAGFVSKSISSQSQALGTGGPSQPLTF